MHTYAFSEALISNVNRVKFRNQTVYWEYFPSSLVSHLVISDDQNKINYEEHSVVLRDSVHFTGFTPYIFRERSSCLSVGFPAVTDFSGFLVFITVYSCNDWRAAVGIHCHLTQNGMEVFYIFFLRWTLRKRCSSFLSFIWLRSSSVPVSTQTVHFSNITNL